MPAKRSSPTLLHRAWELRQETTLAESKLWACLRALKDEGFHFRRQHAIGRYVADFCAPRQHLVIEVDGGQHARQRGPDVDRTTYLKARGYRVIRFSNARVMKDFENVVQAIEGALRSK